jgi:hypothetical protein
MPAYLVRLADTRDLVGFFFAEEVDQLEMIVDECTDVPDCEYVELPEGGIMWESPAIPVPIEIDKDSEQADGEDIPEMPWSSASLTESWWSVLYDYTDEQWTRFVPENPLKPRQPAPRRPMGPGRVVPLRGSDDSGGEYAEIFPFSLQPLLAASWNRVPLSISDRLMHFNQVVAYYPVKLSLRQFGNQSIKFAARYLSDF